MKIRDFNLSIQSSALEPLVDNLYSELGAKGIKFHPPCYLADEWLCPDKEPIIGIPFFLAHPKLKAIEQKMMFEVEGGTDSSCMRLLRHEAGHALNYEYKLYKKTRWRQLFGTFSSKYSNTYYFHPYSRRFVIHLEGNYAQSHPDEDFAETFALWLTPNSSWQIKYKDWPVIKKLRYVDNVMKKISDEHPKTVSQGKPPWSASRMTSTLAAFYEKKRKLLGTEFKGFYDDSLMKLFSQKQSSSSAYHASKILKQYRRQIADNISIWTGHRKYDVYQLINNLISRCDSLELYGKDDDIIAAVSLITAITSNTLRIPKTVQRK
ncbi:MAG: putative zinc-binding metallopeptidase [Phycisphaerae bacterium]|nr:putative zinc-binding metallopeptidase [Phycisphaerae bacterium]